MTTFTWRNKRYMFVGAPFGLKPLTQNFQSTMELILEPCEDFVIVFVDDIVIFSNSLEEHAEHLQRVVGILNKHNFSVLT